MKQADCWILALLNSTTLLLHYIKVQIYENSSKLWKVKQNEYKIDQRWTGNSCD